jgi:hypothetical protein
MQVLERNHRIETPDGPALEIAERPRFELGACAAERQAALAVAVDHRERTDAPLDHALKTVEHSFPCLALVVANQSREPLSREGSFHVQAHHSCGRPR